MLRRSVLQCPELRRPESARVQFDRRVFRLQLIRGRGNVCRRFLPDRESPRCSDGSTKAAHTTHLHHSAEYIKITRPHHPFEGKSLVVLGTRHQRGRLHLIVVLPDGSRSLIPAEWTDLDGCTTAPACPTSVVGSIEDLLRSRRVIDALQRRHIGETPNLNVESACAKQTELHGGPAGATPIGVGSTAGGTQKRHCGNAGASHRKDDRDRTTHRSKQ